MKHYFYLIINTRTYESYYSHDYFRSPDQIALSLKENESLVTVWEAGEKVEF